MSASTRESELKQIFQGQLMQPVCYDRGKREWACNGKSIYITIKSKNGKIITNRFGPFADRETAASHVLSKIYN